MKTLTPQQIKLHKDIKRKGWQEQEKQYLFPSLYGSKAVTKFTKGVYKMYENMQIRSYSSYL